MYVDASSGKKLFDLIKPGMNVLILFGHGLGDVIMFYPAYEAICKLYPDVKFNLYVESGQEELFGYVDRSEELYDLVFNIHYWMAEGTNKTKTELCCEKELGISYELVKNDFYVFNKKYKSPIIGVHFNGTSLPGCVGVNEEWAKLLWTDIEEFGFVPFELHYKHMFHNPVNEKFSFINNTVRNCKPSIGKLIGLLNSCIGFAGVASGPFTIAMSLYSDRVLYLEKSHKLKNYTRKLSPYIINVNEQYNKEIVFQWLSKLKVFINE